MDQEAGFVSQSGAGPDVESGLGPAEAEQEQNPVATGAPVLPQQTAPAYAGSAAQAQNNWTPPTNLPPEPLKAGAVQTDKMARSRTTGEYLLLLGFGLLPVLGIVFCLVWGFGNHWEPEVQALARAMLWLHGIVLVLLVAILAVWVLSLTGGVAAGVY